MYVIVGLRLEGEKEGERFVCASYLKDERQMVYGDVREAQIVCDDQNKLVPWIKYEVYQLNSIES